MSIFVDHKALKHLLKKLKDVLITGPVDGEVLTYEAATKLWKNKPAPAGGTIGKGFKAYLGANQTIPSGVGTMVALSVEVFDDFNEFDPTTYLFTPSITGNYFVAFGFFFQNVLSTYDGRLFRGFFIQETPVMAVKFYAVCLPRLIATRHIIATAANTVRLIAGRTYSFSVDQDTGVNQTLLAGEPNCWLTAFRLF